MIEASCPTHGRRCLTNAGAPNLVRCAIIGTSYEPCRVCHGTGWMTIFSLLPGGDDEATRCPTCKATGWTVYPGRADGVHPVN